MVLRIDIHPDMLVWAYERAGFNRSDAISVFPSLERWLEGRSQPTLKQIEKFAAKFYVPFGYLMLDSPPEEDSIIPMFRRVNQNSLGSLNVIDAIHQIAYRQEWLSDYLSDNGYSPLAFVSSIKKMDVDSVVQRIRDLLDTPESWVLQYNSPDDLVRALSSKIEDLRVSVSFNGVVGNNTHRIISVEDCRGFSLVDRYAPFIFVNNSDAKRAQYFTLIHEFAHILIGYGSSYGLDSVTDHSELNERFCDEVAARFLVPSSFLNQYWKGLSELDEILRKTKASRMVIARRALAQNLISQDNFREFCNSLGQERTSSHSRNGGNFYPTAQKRLGSVFSTHVANAVRSGQLLFGEAYRLTGLHGNTFSRTLRLSTI